MEYPIKSKDKTILVTGGAGYIGSHTCKALAAAGYLPVVYDNLSTGHAYAVKWGPFVQGDLNDKAALRGAFAAYQPMAVIHFAANALVAESIRDPAKYYRNNVSSTITLLDVMQAFGVKKLIFSSTCATYGHPEKLPLTETHPQLPISPYGRSKWMIEQILADYAAAYGLEPTILRYFNAAGADLNAEIGENHTPETHLIPTVIQAALGMRDEIVVYGTDFESKDGSAIRDYIHVQDLATAHVAALQAPSCSLNLGSGHGISVFEIIEAVETFCGKKLSVRKEKRRFGDPAILTADPTRAQQILNWSPEVSDVATLISSAWKWHQLLFDSEPLIRSALK